MRVLARPDRLTRAELAQADNVIVREQSWEQCLFLQLNLTLLDEHKPAVPPPHSLSRRLSPSSFFPLHPPLRNHLVSASETFSLDVPSPRPAILSATLEVSGIRTVAAEQFWNTELYRKSSDAPPPSAVHSASRCRRREGIGLQERKQRKLDGVSILLRAAANSAELSADQSAVSAFPQKNELGKSGVRWAGRRGMAGVS